MTFLYPYAFLLLFIPFIFYFLSEQAEKNTAWAKICDAHLLPYLMVKIGGTGSKFYRWIMLFCWIVGCICLAGPALEQKIQTASAQSGLVVVVDMSPAMRDETAFQMVRKLYDLADYKKDTAIGLVLADTKAYVALPITADKTVFKNILPDLKENIMPSMGQNYVAGIEKATQLLQQSGFKKGQILLLTAGTAENAVLANAVKNSTYPISVIGLGNLDVATPITLSNGRFWGDDEPVLLGLNGLKDILGSKYMKATIDETDLKTLLQQDSLENIEKSNYEIVQYQNLGIYGILLLLPFVSLLFRKGVLFILLFCLLPLTAHAGFWWRDEQEIYQKQMQAIADFNTGDYEKAAQLFEHAGKTDVEALYNLGNTLAYMGQFEKAIQTYEKVLSLNPQHFDAEYNLTYLKENLPPPPPQEQQEQSGQSNENQEQSSKQNEASSSEEENQQSDSSPNQSKTSGVEDKKQENSKENEENEQNAQPQMQENNAKEQKENESTIVPDDTEQKQNAQDMAQALTPAEQKEKEWMDKVQFDAGRVLRYRLAKQYQE